MNLLKHSGVLRTITQTSDNLVHQLLHMMVFVLCVCMAGGGGGGGEGGRGFLFFLLEFFFLLESIVCKSVQNLCG